MEAVNKVANDNLFNVPILVKAMEELIALLNIEIEALKNNNSQSIAQNYSRKIDLIQYIENQNDTLKKHESVRTSLPKQDVERLKKLAQELQDTISVNKVELEKAQLFNKELINLVVEAVTSEGVDAKSYDRAGKKKKLNSKKVTPQSVTINETV